MWNKSKVYFFLLLGALMVSSCTIQKRLFLPGYDIQWKNKSLIEKKEVKESVASEELTEEQRETASTYDCEPILIQEAALKDSLAENIVVKPVSYENKHQTNRQMSICELDDKMNQSEQMKCLKPLNHQLENKKSEPKYHPLSFVCLFTSILILPSFLLILIAEIYLIVPIFLFVFTFVTSLLVLDLIRRKPEKYKGKGLLRVALVGLLFAGILTALFLMIVNNL